VTSTKGNVRKMSLSLINCFSLTISLECVNCTSCNRNKRNFFF